jgi:hypothetical protein
MKVSKVFESVQVLLTRRHIRSSPFCWESTRPGAAV